MKKSFLNKLLRATELHEMWPVNPQSPLLIFRKSQRACTIDGVSILSSLQNHEEESKQINSNGKTLNQPNSNGLKQSESRFQTTIDQTGNTSRHFLSKKYQSKRVKTVPYGHQQRYKMCDSTGDTEIKPVLMIKEIKPKSSAIYKLKHENQEQIISNQTLEQISIKLKYITQSRQKPSPEKYQFNLTTQYETLKQRLKNTSPTKTLNNFTNNLNTVKNRNRSINAKKMTLKAEDALQQKLKERKIMSISYSKPIGQPRNITAKSYIIYQTSCNNSNPKIIISQHSKSRQEIASLTKIMTAILIIELCKRFSIDKYAEEVIVTPFEAKICGTSASIKEGEIYTIDQLLYGLMLPSGNDASLALATWAGSKLLEESAQSIAKRQNKQKLKIYSIEEKVDSQQQKKQRHYKRFIEQMNAKAKELKLKRTTYANSHGLSNQQNKSCAYDQALLSEYCMQNQSFRNIVSCKHYTDYIKTIPKETTILQPQQRSVKNSFLEELLGRKHSLHNPRLSHNKVSLPKPKGIKVQWQNTHELLRRCPEEYIGIKTGFTYTAGPCLASCIKYENRQYLIIVLGCESQSMRFQDTQTLRKWCMSQELTKKSPPQKHKQHSVMKKVNEKD